MVGITEGDEVNDQLHSSHELLDKSKAMPEPVGGEVDEEVDGTEEAPGSDKVMPNPYTTTAIPQESSYTSDPSLVQNTMLHYGEFCGPGPKLVSVPLCNKYADRRENARKTFKSEQCCIFLLLWFRLKHIQLGLLVALGLPLKRCVFASDNQPFSASQSTNP